MKGLLNTAYIDLMERHKPMNQEGIIVCRLNFH